MLGNVRQSSPFDRILINERNERPLRGRPCDYRRGLVDRFRADPRLGSHGRELRVLV
jgi:hypothetical protein